MNTSENLLEKTVGQFVTANYRTAQIFSDHGIDFCCKGNRTLREAADAKGLSSDNLIKELDQVQAQSHSGIPDFSTWPLDLLVDYIEKKHHRYVEQQIPIILKYLQKVCKVHGEAHPELYTIQKQFSASAGELTKHLKKEELLLFPWIRKMVQTTSTGKALSKPQFGSVANPIGTMMEEHDQEGERFALIAQISNNYTPPVDACSSYRITYHLLKEFQDDLHAHVHLENNILFPKVKDLETQFGYA